MKVINLFYLLLITYWSIPSFNTQDVSTEMREENYTVHNRKVDFSNGVAHLNAKTNDGILWLNHSNFKNGSIELDIKGKNAPGESFVGLAFHGQNNKTFDAVYFRPFNFKNSERKDHSIQYISMPKNDWSTLRNAFPGKYENEITPLPEDENDWFHVRIEIYSPKVEVFVNHATSPTLSIEKISKNHEGQLGLWVGNGSEGWFKNLKIKGN